MAKNPVPKPLCIRGCFRITGEYLGFKKPSHTQIYTLKIGTCMCTSGISSFTPSSNHLLIRDGQCSEAGVHKLHPAGAITPSSSDTVQRKQNQANFLGMPYFVFTDVPLIVALGMILEESYKQKPVSTHIFSSPRTCDGVCSHKLEKLNNCSAPSKHLHNVKS